MHLAIGALYITACTSNVINIHTLMVNHVTSLPRTAPQHILFSSFATFLVPHGDCGMWYRIKHPLCHVCHVSCEFTMPSSSMYLSTCTWLSWATSVTFKPMAEKTSSYVPLAITLSSGALHLPCLGSCVLRPRHCADPNNSACTEGAMCIIGSLHYRAYLPARHGTAVWYALAMELWRASVITHRVHNTKYCLFIQRGSASLPLHWYDIQGWF